MLGALERLQAKLVQREEWSHSAAVGSLRGALQSPLFNHILTLQHSIKQLRSQVGGARKQGAGLSLVPASTPLLSVLTPSPPLLSVFPLSPPQTPPFHLFISPLPLLSTSSFPHLFPPPFSSFFSSFSCSFISISPLSSSILYTPSPPILKFLSSLLRFLFAPFQYLLYLLLLCPPPLTSSPLCASSTINSQIKIMAVTSSERRPASYSKCCQGQQRVYEDLAPPTVCRHRRQQLHHRVNV